MPVALYARASLPYRVLGRILSICVLLVVGVSSWLPAQSTDDKWPSNLVGVWNSIVDLNTTEDVNIHFLRFTKTGTYKLQTVTVVYGFDKSGYKKDKVMTGRWLVRNDASIGRRLCLLRTGRTKPSCSTYEVHLKADQPGVKRDILLLGDEALGEATPEMFRIFKMTDF